MRGKQALEGVNILDFSWVIAGPATTRYLASHGATVIKVESKNKLDLFRAYIPMADGIPGVNRCATFDAYNNDKYGVTLDLSKPKGIEIAKRLATWADVVVENFMPGTMERWELSYDDLRKIKPDIIMVSLSMQGETGPRSRQAGFGTELQSLAGFTNLISWPDRIPAGTNNPYTDFVVPWYAIVAIITALDHRSRTGEGQYLDICQLEGGAMFLSPALFDYTVNGRIAAPSGNRSPNAAPHGVYRCRGEDRWCVIGVFTGQEWHSFANAMGNPPWSKDPKFTTLLGRKQHEDELDKLIETGTINFAAEEVMTKMQSAGVAAGIVATGKDLHDDPQLKHRGHFKLLNHAEIGLHSYELPSWRLSKTPADIRMVSPLLGEHTHYVASEILGMSDEEFVQLLEAKVFE